MAHVRTPLITVAELAGRLRSGQPTTVLDVRWRLSGPPGRDDYEVGHLPGAVFVDLDRDLCGPPGAGGRHPLPHPEALEGALRAAGVREGRPVVVYDAGDGMAAARAWWTLRWAGHADVRVLDGGFAAWSAAGGEVTDKPVEVVRGDVTVLPGGMPVLDAAGAAALAADGVLLDARVAPRFRGETEPIDAVAGHVPGARNLPYGELVNADGTLRADLPEVFADLGDAPVGAYCGSGVTAAHTVLALHAAGRTDAALYVGSWSHWITDPSRPVGRG
ncbi:sulfurtransferase [Catellatospora coxensis]|uniref:sulfurtransferase n=1 Tax=Catellatospora coxensis TaxID=310354 RepID=UPI0019430A76